MSNEKRMPNIPKPFSLERIPSTYEDLLANVVSFGTYLNISFYNHERKGTSIIIVDGKRGDTWRKAFRCEPDEIGINYHTLVEVWKHIDQALWGKTPKRHQIYGLSVEQCKKIANALGAEVSVAPCRTERCGLTYSAEAFLPCWIRYTREDGFKYIRHHGHFDGVYSDLTVAYRQALEGLLGSMNIDVTDGYFTLPKDVDCDV